MLRKTISPAARSGQGRNLQEQVTESNKPDAEELAARIRELAIDAHHALNDRFVTAARLADLSRRITWLRKGARSARLGEIDRWLHQVKRRVEERWPAARLTTRA